MAGAAGPRGGPAAAAAAYEVPAHHSTPGGLSGATDDGVMELMTPPEPGLEGGHPAAGQMWDGNVEATAGGGGSRRESEALSKNETSRGGTPESATLDFGIEDANDHDADNGAGAPPRQEEGAGRSGPPTDAGDGEAVDADALDFVMSDSASDDAGELPLATPMEAMIDTPAEDTHGLGGDREGVRAPPPGSLMLPGGGGEGESHSTLAPAPTQQLASLYSLDTVADSHAAEVAGGDAGPVGTTPRAATPSTPEADDFAADAAPAPEDANTDATNTNALDDTVVVGSDAGGGAGGVALQFEHPLAEGDTMTPEVGMLDDGVAGATVGAAAIALDRSTPDANPLITHTPAAAGGAGSGDAPRADAGDDGETAGETADEGGGSTRRSRRRGSGKKTRRRGSSQTPEPDAREKGGARQTRKKSSSRSPGRRQQSRRNEEDDAAQEVVGASPKHLEAPTAGDGAAPGGSDTDIDNALERVEEELDEIERDSRRGSAAWGRDLEEIVIAAEAALERDDDEEEDGEPQPTPADAQQQPSPNSAKRASGASAATASPRAAPDPLTTAHPSAFHPPASTSTAAPDALRDNGAKASSANTSASSAGAVLAAEERASAQALEKAASVHSTAASARLAAADAKSYTSSKVASGKQVSRARRQDNDIETFVRCGAATLERAMSYITPERVYASGRKKLLAGLETEVLRSMQSAGAQLQRAVDAYSSAAAAATTTRDNRPPVATLNKDEAARFFSALVRTSIMILSPLAAGWAIKLYEVFGGDYDKLVMLVGELPDGEPSPMLSGAVAEAVHSRWEEVADELAQMWQAFCTTSLTGEVTDRDVVRAFVGDGAVSLAAMTQVVLCRPRVQSPKDLHAPVAGASPLFAGVPAAWISSTRVQQNKYTAVRFVLTKPRCTRVLGHAFSLKALKLLRANGDIIDGISLVDLNLADGGGGALGAMGEELPIEQHLQDSAMGIQNLTAADGVWKLRINPKYPKARVEIRFEFQREEAVAGYIMQTSSEPADHDPAAWLFQAYDPAADSWNTLHNGTHVHVPRAREAWGNPCLYGDVRTLERWVGENVVVKDDIGSRFTSTATLMKGKAYLVLLFLSPWMPRWDIYARMASTFYVRHAKKKNFEMIVVASTQDHGEFRELHKAVPCAAVVHSDTEKIKLLETMCQFDGSVKAVVFHNVERLLDDLSPYLLTEDGFPCMRKDPDAKGFPWSVQAADEEAADARANGGDTDATAPTTAAAKAADAQLKSRKAKYIPYMTAASIVLAGVLGVWPIALAMSVYNKGVCEEYEVAVDNTIDVDTCVRASDPGGATCNKGLLQNWFLVNGIVLLFFMGLATWVVYGVWQEGLHRWDLTLADSWVSGCCSVLTALFLIAWYVLGNVLIWEADDAVCGTLSSVGRGYFYTTYIIYLTLVILFCCTMAKDRPGGALPDDVEDPRRVSRAQQQQQQQQQRRATRAKSRGQGGSVPRGPPQGASVSSPHE